MSDDTLDMSHPLTLGARLRRRREAKGLSLEEVARATKIHVNVLTLIEADRAASLNAVYLKGFLKTYGGYLGEDVPALLALLPATPSVPVQPMSPPTHRSNRPRAVASSASTILQTLMRGLQRLPWRPLITSAVVIAALWVGGARLRASLIRHQAQPQPASSTRRGAAAPVRPPSKPSIKPKPAAARMAKPKTKATTPVLPTTGAPVQLTMRVQSMTWMRVTADGSVVFQDVLQPGARETWLARQDIVLWLGDAGGVTLELNGRQLGAPGKRGEIVRALRITSAGIQR